MDKVYNNGKNQGGAVMKKKLGFWDYIFLVLGIIGILIPFGLFFTEVSTVTLIRSIIAPFIGLSLLSRFFKAYRESKENDD